MKSCWKLSIIYSLLPLKKSNTQQYEAPYGTILLFNLYYCWIAVVSPTSRFANDSFANVLGRFANVLSRFANVLRVNSPTSK